MSVLIEWIQNISSDIAWVQNMISVFALIIGAFVYMWYRNNKNMKDKSIFSEIENNDVIVGTIINVQITKERDPRECLITVETSGGKYIETKIIVPIFPLKGRTI